MFGNGKRCMKMVNYGMKVLMIKTERMVYGKCTIKMANWRLKALIN